MGREIRRVVPNWEHPKTERRNGQIDYQPMYDASFHERMVEWWNGYNEWRNGTHKDFEKYGKDYPNYWDWHGGPPDPEYYRPEWKEGEATWFQVYETVSEGTPVTPPFATKEELVEYLVANGDFWDQKRREEGPKYGFQIECAPWPRKAAENFVLGAGWAPSLISGPGIGIQPGHLVVIEKESQ